MTADQPERRWPADRSPIHDTPGGALYGRDHEIGVLDDLIRRPGSGTGGVLVIRGEAGIGKSALVAAASARGRRLGMRVLAATGVESEARIPFAGLHQLLRPVLSLAGGLPTRQRAALLAAFGMGDETSGELFLIGLAALELVSDTAARSPLLLVAEDAQWLDDASCAVLAFVARRLAAEPTAMLIAVRDGFGTVLDDAGLTELRLQGLPPEAAAALLDAHAPGLAPGPRERVLAEAAGNPLALVELPAALRSVDLDSGVLAPSRLRLTARLERAFAAQQSGLPTATRSLLLVAAADDGDVPAEMFSAAAILEGTEVTVDALGPAVTARLLEFDGFRVRFRHPLARSAVYQAASPARRHAAHAALAGVLASQPDRQVWHRAAAALGPDEHVAAALDDAARRAERRGAAGVAISALQRAAQLSEKQGSRGARLLRAASIAFDTGQPGLGPQLLAAAGQLDLSAEERTWLSWQREVYGTDWSGADRLGSFVALAERMRADGRADVAMESLLGVAMRCWWGNPAPPVRVAVTDIAERLGLPADDPRLLAVLALADPVGRGAQVIDQISRLAPDAADPVGMHLVGLAASSVWAYDLSLGFLSVAVDGLRAQGTLGLLARVLVSQAWAAAHLARELVAMSAAEEAYRLSGETAQPRWAAAARLAQAAIAAERGDFDLAETLTVEAEAVLVPMGAGPMLALAQFVRGRGAVAHRRYTEGLEQLQRTLDPADPAYNPFVGYWGLSDLVEASAHTGRAADARAYLDQLESLAKPRQRRCCGPRPLTRGQWSRPTTRPRLSTGPHSTATWPDGSVTGPVCCCGTAGGCAASDGWRNPARRCGRPGPASTRWPSPISPKPPAASCAPQARRAAAALPKPGTSSRRKNCRSAGLRPLGYPTARSASSFTSPTGPSATTCTGSSPSSGSPPAASCTPSSPPRLPPSPVRQASEDLRGLAAKWPTGVLARAGTFGLTS